jgi:hypothetical protein
MARKRKFQPIELIVDDPSDIFQSHRQEISKAIVEGVDYGIKYKKKRVDFAKVIINDILVITLSIDSREFADLLDEQLQTLIDFEEYETCALLMKLKEKLNENVTKKVRIPV